MRLLVALVFTILLGSTEFQAQNKLSRGTFSVEGGNYTLDAEIKNSKLYVYEPNRDTPYTHVSGTKYQYYHEGFKKTYYVEIVDPNTLYFTSSNVQGTTVLKRVDGQALATSGDRHDKYMEIAEKYQALASNKTDDDYEVQAYSFCAASALNGAMKTEKEYYEYARQSAIVLKSISVNPNKNPCSDAIPDSVWKSASAN